LSGRAFVQTPRVEYFRFGLGLGQSERHLGYEMHGMKRLGYEITHTREYKKFNFNNLSASSFSSFQKVRGATSLELHKVRGGLDV